ncbi:MAG: hypothetical protein WD768_18100 [Phycisphaeraceae bacterium]
MPLKEINLYCPSCGYDLRGSPRGDCPECGKAVDREAMLTRLLSDDARPIRGALLLIVTAPFFFCFLYAALRNEFVWVVYAVFMLAVLGIATVADMAEASFRHRVRTGRRPGFVMASASVVLLMAALGFVTAIMTMAAYMISISVFRLF